MEMVNMKIGRQKANMSVTGQFSSDSTFWVLLQAGVGSWVMLITEKMMDLVRVVGDGG